MGKTKKLVDKIKAIVLEDPDGNGNNEEIELQFERTHDKVNLLGREIGIEIISKAHELGGTDRGAAYLIENRMVIAKGNDSFETILHELMHFYLYYTGHDLEDTFRIERMCDIPAMFISQLLLENGSDIFDRLSVLGK